MKINRLETHDRLLHLQKDQALNLSQGAADCLQKNTLSLALQRHSPYIYIFAHPRTSEDGLSKRMLWQPRLLKPTAQTNSYLFRAKSNGDTVEVCWMLPPREMWAQYKKGQVTENEIVNWSIVQFETNRADLEAAAPDDLSSEQAKNVYLKVARELEEESRLKKMYLKPNLSEEFWPLPSE